MRKISTRIVLTVLICSIAMATIVGATSMIRSMDAIEKEAKENLFGKGQISTGDLNQKLVAYESTISTLYQLIDGTINTKKLKEENYLSNYSQTILDPVVGKIAEETEDCIGAYIAFDPKYTGTTEGIWVAVDNNGNAEHSMPTEISGKSVDDPAASWYYDAIKAGEGYWSDPYKNNADLDVLTYSKPIIVDGDRKSVV